MGLGEVASVPKYMIKCIYIIRKDLAAQNRSLIFRGIGGVLDPSDFS
jgi:hypothetical protein